MKSKISQQGDDTAAAKQSLRQTMRRLREQLSREQAQQAARQAAENLLCFVEARAVTAVAVYAAVHGELCPDPALSRLRDQGITLAFPRVMPDLRTLQFHRVDEPEVLVPGTFGVPEPPATAQPIAVAEIDLFVVPGLAFDRHGYRLGWGKGYYDATLASAHGIRVGFAHHCQFVDQVPRTHRDLAMDVVITDASIVHTHARVEPPGQPRDE